MPTAPDGQRTKKRREKLLGLGLIQKNVWVPAMFASALMAFAFDLRRKAGMLLPTDPREGNETADNSVTSNLVDGQAPILTPAAAELANRKTKDGVPLRGKR